MKKYIVIIIIFVMLILSRNSVYAVDISQVAQELDLYSLIDTLKDYTKGEIDIDSMTESLMEGKGLNYSAFGTFVVEKLFYELHIGIKSCVSILIVVIMLAIIKGLELEKDNTITCVASLVGFLIIVVIALKSYFVALKTFTETITLLTAIVEVIAPFMLAILIATGEVVTCGIIGPVLLFLASLVGVLVTYLIVPFLTIGLVFKIISNMSDTIKLDRLAGMFSNTAMWVTAIVFALFLGVMELESNVTTGVDKVAIKTTQTAVSNLIPVVGKFVSDSLEVVMGSAEIIGKVVGTIGIIVIILISLVPIIKIVLHSLMYSIVAAISELLNTDKKITELCGALSKQYKTMLGLMIGVMITFIIGIGIVINLMGKVVS